MEQGVFVSFEKLSEYFIKLNCYFAAAKLIALLSALGEIALRSKAIKWLCPDC